MATGLVINITVGDDRHTEILADDEVRIGSSGGCNLRVRASNLPTSPAKLDIAVELSRSKDSVYHVSDFDHSLSITHNGKPIEIGSEIRDGDEVRFPPSNLALQLFPVRSLPAVIPAPERDTYVAPFIEAAAIESAATARRDDAKVFLREFTRELVREINTSTKLIALAIVLLLVGGMLYIGFGLYREVQTSRRVIDNQRSQISEMKNQVDRTNADLGKLVRSNQQIRDSLSLAPTIRNDYGGGVCLIAGSFYFVEAGSGRQLRYPETQTSDGSAAAPGATEPSLTPEGKGAVAEFEFVGSGFYVGDGFVVTNRHIAQPWRADDRAQSLGNIARGQPRLKKLVAYFPDHPQPYSLKFKQVAQQEDLSVCTIDSKEIPTDIPVLPLESESEAVAVGKMVVMMGYPNGPDRLLALLDDNESRGIQQRYGSMDALLGYLAESKRIQPQTTQGTITDLNGRRIAYDARTAEGGSGAPLFGPSKRVIGVNFAVFTESQASNFAVPIRYAIALLERSGWQPAAAPENVAEGAKEGQPAAHPVTPNK